jgi:hypothetical protein
MSTDVMIDPCVVLFPKLGVTAGAVIDCARSGYTIADAAEELCVSRVRMYRVVRACGLRALFPPRAVATHIGRGSRGRRAVQTKAWLAERCVGPHDRNACV